ncbi:MAG TPA: DUF2269 family protein [Ktedonobacterales bacterium]
MSLALSLKLLHVLVAFWLVSGLLGRTFALGEAARASEITRVRTLVSLAGTFESRMVIPGSFAILLLGLATAWAQGLPLFGVFQGARTNWLLLSLVLYVAVMAQVPLVFIPRGKQFGIALEDASRQGAVTPALQEAFRDPAVCAARLIELAAIRLILVMMVLRPF